METKLILIITSVVIVSIVIWKLTSKSVKQVAVALLLIFLIFYAMYKFLIKNYPDSGGD